MAERQLPKLIVPVRSRSVALPPGLQGLSKVLGCGFGWVSFKFNTAPQWQVLPIARRLGVCYFSIGCCEQIELESPA